MAEWRHTDSERPAQGEEVLVAFYGVMDQCWYREVAMYVGGTRRFIRSGGGELPARYWMPLPDTSGLKVETAKGVANGR